MDFLTNLDNPQVRRIVANNSAAATAAAIEGGDFFLLARVDPSPKRPLKVARGLVRPHHGHAGPGCVWAVILNFPLIQPLD